MVSLSLSHTVGSLLFDHPDSFFSARGNEMSFVCGDGLTYTLHERDGLFELDSYERSEPPQVFARATHIDDMLRHIITIAGDAYRERRNYLYIRLPYRTPKPGYTPISITPEWTTIQRYDGTLLPFELCGTPPSIEVNEYTYLADLPLDDIAASYKHPHAYPLYHDYLATTRYLPPG